jgi:hypothetical protein
MLQILLKCLVFQNIEYDEDRVSIQSYRIYSIQECFLRNKVDGRRLIWCDASHLNALGIQDFKHIMVSKIMIT